MAIALPSIKRHAFGCNTKALRIKCDGWRFAIASSTFKRPMLRYNAESFRWMGDRFKYNAELPSMLRDAEMLERHC